MWWSGHRLFFRGSILVGFALSGFTHGQSLETVSAQHAFVEDVLPEKLDELYEAMRFEIPLEFDFESINASKDPVAVYQTLSDGGLINVLKAFIDVSANHLTQQAMFDRVSQIRFVNRSDSGVIRVGLDKDGILTIEMDGTQTSLDSSYTILRKFLDVNLRTEGSRSGSLPTGTPTAIVYPISFD